MRTFSLLLLFPLFTSSQKMNSAFVTASNLGYTKVQSSNEGRFGFELNGKIGYLDSKGNVVIPPEYSYDSSSASFSNLPSFYNGYAKVIKDRKAGVIDKTGKLVIPLEYEGLTVNTSYGNFVTVYQTKAGKKMYGVVTLQNKQLVPMEYEEIRIDTNLILAKQNAKWGLFDKTGKNLLPLDYLFLTAYPGDKVLKAEKGTQYGFIDYSGKWLFEKAKSVYTLLECGQGMITCLVNKKYGYLNLKGDEVIMTRYDMGYTFESSGLAKVGNLKPGSSFSYVYGYIDKKGNEIIPLKYELLGNFFNGLVYAKDPETNRYGYLDKSGKWALPAVYLEATSFDVLGGAWVKMTDGKYHYINKAGKDIGQLDDQGVLYRNFDRSGYTVYESTESPYVAIDKTGKIINKIEDCDAIYSFMDGIAGIRCKSNMKYGFVDWNGNKIIACEYDGFSTFSEGLLKVDKKTDSKTKSGYIDANGHVVVPIVYDNLTVFRNGWGVTKKDSNYFFIDRTGIIREAPRRYDELSEFRSGYALGKIKGAGSNPATFYYINTQLKEEFSFLAREAYSFWGEVAIVKRNTEYEMINKRGEFYKTLSGYDFLKFSNEGMLAVRSGGKWGFINERGDVIVKPQYDSCDSYKFGYAKVKKGTRWGIIDKIGTEIIEPKFENIYPGENGWFIFYEKSGWGILDKTGTVVVPPTLYTLSIVEKDRALARLGKTYTILKSPLTK